MNENLADFRHLGVKLFLHLFSQAVRFRDGHIGSSQAVQDYIVAIRAWPGVYFVTAVQAGHSFGDGHDLFLELGMNRPGYLGEHDRRGPWLDMGIDLADIG